MTQNQILNKPSGSSGFYWDAWYCNLDQLEIFIKVRQHHPSINAPDDRSNTALHYVVGNLKPINPDLRIECIKALIKAGADVNAVGEYGFTPLHCAAVIGCGESIEVLLGADAYPRPIDDEDETPLDLAKKNRHWAIANILRKGGAE